MLTNAPGDSTEQPSLETSALDVLGTGKVTACLCLQESELSSEKLSGVRGNPSLQESTAKLGVSAGSQQ